VINDLETEEFSYVEHTYSSDDKMKWWGYGEWVEEVDYAAFSYKGWECVIRRECFYDGPVVFGGFLCGYVKIPENYRLYTLSPDVNTYTLSKFYVHGGITYFSFPFWDEEILYLGFDCGHVSDINPSFNRMREFPEEFPEEFCSFLDSLFHKCNSTYKNISFVKKELECLCDQLSKLDQ